MISMRKYTLGTGKLFAILAIKFNKLVRMITACKWNIILFKFTKSFLKLISGVVRRFIDIIHWVHKLGFAFLNRTLIFKVGL
jgi:hypothetical protein